MDYFPIESLPHEVLALILSKTTPRDVRVTSSVSKRFNEIANDDLVWMAFLPRNVNEVIRKTHGEFLAYDSSKTLYHRLTHHFLLGDGTEGYWIDHNTAGVCRSFSARTLKITWGDTPQYWEWGPYESSRFHEVAKLRDVCWLELTGEINTRLPPGAYTLSWVLTLDQFGRVYGLHYPVTFCTSDALGALEETTKIPLDTKRVRAYIDVSCQKAPNTWSYYNVKHFTVERTENSDPETLGEVNLRFSMREIYGGQWKRGLVVDGVVIRAGKFDLTDSCLSL